jgi:hypothetical protein
VRVVVYDRTDRLTAAWAPGALLYRVAKGVDQTHGVATWDEAIAWIASRDAPISELQYWGHGTWGRVLVDRAPLDASSLHRLAPVRDALAPGALVWLRTCEAFGTRAGHDFARRLADTLGARVAGHTYVIGFYQSGLHALAPGMQPDWSADEGVVPGEASARRSGRREPRTITCMHGRIPAGW